MRTWERYVLLRQAGKGCREAARDAGYAAGVPSCQAREIAAAAVRVQNNPEAAAWVNGRIAKLEAELTTLRALQRAIQLLHEPTIDHETECQEAA